MAAMALRESGTSPRKRNDDTKFGRRSQEIGGNKRKAPFAAAAALQGLGFTRRTFEILQFMT